MRLSVFTVLTGLLCFSLITILGSFLVLRTKRRSFWLLGLVFALGLLRFLVPVEFHNTRVIRCTHVYPIIMKFLRRDLWPGFSLLEGLCVLWCAGIVWSLFRLALTLYRQHQIARLCQAPEEGSQLHRLCCQAAQELRCTKPVMIGVSQTVSTVIMIGFTKPTILFPSKSMQLSEEQLRCILLHELCHFRYRDLWLKLVLQVVCCLLWWNPLVYLFKSNIDQILELRCDRRVCNLLSKKEQLQYSSALLCILKAGKPARSLSTKYLGIPSKARLRQRFRFLLQEHRPKSSSGRSWIAALLCVMLFLGSYSIVLQPGTEHPYVERECEQPEGTLDLSSYICRYPDGTLQYSKDGTIIRTLTPEMLSVPPYDTLLIVDVSMNRAFGE